MRKGLPKEGRVSVRKAGGDLKESIKKSLSDWNGVEYIREKLRYSRKVLIKVNLAGGGRDRRGTQTSPDVVVAVGKVLREIDPSVEIRVIESPSIVWWSLKRVFEGSLFQKKLEENGLEFIDLSRIPSTTYRFGGKLGDEAIPSILLEERFLIDLPVAKTHAFFVLSGAIKNLFGLLPSPHKLLRYHTKGFGDYRGEIFLDIYKNFPPDLVVIDGTFSGEGMCPVAGRAKNTDFILTSDDALSADMVLSRLMGMEPEEIPYLRVAIRKWGMPELKVFSELDSPLRIRRVRFKLFSLFVNFLWVIVENIKALWRRKWSG